MSVLYRQVYDKLRSDIESHRFQVGQRLPSDSELIDEHAVSSITVKRALDLLRNDGFIVRRPKLGTFVISDVATSDSNPRSQMTKPLMGCVVTNFDDTFGTRIVSGLIDQAQGVANLVINRSLGDRDVEDQLVRGLVDGGAKALIMEPSTSEFVPPAILELITRSFPVVIIDRILEGVPVSTVCSDNIGAARTATEHLFALGHERVGLVTSASRVSTLEERRRGFILAHATFSVHHDESHEFRSVTSTQPLSSGTPEEDVAALQAYLTEHADLTAFVATEYNIALLLAEACRRLGLGVPGDRSIVCFDHQDLFFDRDHFRFTHIRQDQTAMGSLAVQQALAQLTKPLAIRKHSLITELVEGQSTRQLNL